MAIIFTEGFDAYGTSGISSPTGAPLRRGWNRDGQTETGRINGYALGLRHNLITGVKVLNYETTKTVGYALYLEDTLPVNKYYVFTLYDGSTIQMSVKLNADRKLEVYRGDSVLLATGTTVIDIASWRYVEFKTTIDDSAGAYELRIDGILELSDSGIDTQMSSNSYWEFFGFRVLLSGLYRVHVDDFYILDSTGSSNNDFLGPIHIETLFPDADVTSQWTTSTGVDHYAMVDENPADDDTSYLEDDTTGQRELFDFPALAPGTLDIFAVTSVLDANITEAEILDLKFVNQSDTTVTTGSAVEIISDTRLRYTEIYEEDPDASSPWTKTTLEAAQFGFEVG